jgi:hypothetical protein
VAAVPIPHGGVQLSYLKSFNHHKIKKTPTYLNT